MLKISFTNAEVSDHGYGLEVNGKSLEDIISTALGTKLKGTARVAGISVELGMSVQNKSGIWCKPTVKMDIKIDGGTNPQQREAIIKQAFDEVCDNIEKTISEME